MIIWNNPKSILQEAEKMWTNHSALMNSAVTQEMHIAIGGTVPSHNITMKRIWVGAQWYINSD